ncbi:spermatogenesis-associated serine-rich protein 1 isoform X1 [Hoplias malabaricus]|uniref:spermatogenesis-associated serine-rich protein 1 isoform X1 n=1 Tax=Hoplias malabaricus TaxID=27720 RepID=UPI003461BFB1
MAESRYSHTQERVFRPHIRHTEPILTECDLDWKSRLRWIPEPRYSDAPFPQIKDIKFPDQIKLIRSFPQDNMMSRSEWTFYPNFGQPVTYHVGKRCFIDNIHHGAKRCTSEHTLESTIGKKKLVNQGCCSVAGSRTFLIPEYSPNFHKLGSTLPKASFGDLTSVLSMASRAEAERPGQPRPAHCPIDPQRRRASDGRDKAQHLSNDSSRFAALRCFAIELCGHCFVQILLDCMNLLNQQHTLFTIIIYSPVNVGIG